MRQGGYNLGGEQSGHLIFLDHTSTGDGLIAGAAGAGADDPHRQAALGARARGDGARAAGARERHARRRASRSRRWPSLQRLVEQVRGALGKEGRVLVRWSGTEPKLRVMVEGPDENRIGTIAQDLIDGGSQGRGLSGRRGRNRLRRRAGGSEPCVHSGSGWPWPSVAPPVARAGRLGPRRRDVEASVRDWSGRVERLLASGDLDRAPRARGHAARRPPPRAAGAVVRGACRCSAASSPSRATPRARSRCSARCTRASS